MHDDPDDILYDPEDDHETADEDPADYLHLFDYYEDYEYDEYEADD